METWSWWYPFHFRLVTTIRVLMVSIFSECFSGILNRPNNVDDVKSPTRTIRQNDNPTNFNFQHQYPDGSYHFILTKLAAVFRHLIQIIASSTSSLTPFYPCSFGRDSSTNLHIRRVKQIIRLLDGFISKRDHDYHFSRFNWAWTVILNLKNVKDSN